MIITPREDNLLEHALDRAGDVNLREPVYVGIIFYNVRPKCSRTREGGLLWQAQTAAGHIFDDRPILSILSDRSHRVCVGPFTRSNQALQLGSSTSAEVVPGNWSVAYTLL